MSESVNYNALVKSYYENLYNTLRNFRPGPEFLEDWVHDEDHNRSLLGIFEAAHNHGMGSLSVELGKDTVTGLNRDWLCDNLKVMGSLSFENTPDGLRLNLKFNRRTNIHQVHPAYQKELSKAQHDLRHEGNFAESDNTFTTVCSEGRLRCSIHNSIVTEAKHSQANGAFRPLLDRFCDILLATPIQDAAEHATIALERNLRNPFVPPPVPGLVTPFNADPMFLVPLNLIREIYAQWKRSTQSQDSWNEFERPISDHWKHLSDSERLTEVNQVLACLVTELKIPYSGIEAIQIKNSSRVYFARNDFTKLARSGGDLMKVERELKRRLEPRIEVVLESMEDKNHREGRTNRDLMKN